MSSNMQILKSDSDNALNFISEAVSDGKIKSAEEMEVDLVELSSNDKSRETEVLDTVGTEYSSSFVDTSFSNDNCSVTSDAEVESVFDAENSYENAFDGFSNVLPLRKKKLTDHWRNYIRPLMWRCKWIELKVKELESQASKYSRVIAAYDQRKSVELDQFNVEEFHSMSLSFTSQNHERKAMKRRKRKKVEDATDIASYMSHHILFSCRENWRSDQDGTSIVDDLGNSAATEKINNVHNEIGISNDLSFLEDNNCFLEQTLRNVDKLQSRVHKLKAQLNLLISKNVVKFSSSESLSHLVLCDGQTSSIRSSTFSACNGETVSVGGLCAPAHMLECDIGDMVVPENTVSSYRDATTIPDIIESTIGLLSSVDVTQLQPQVGDSSENIVDNILIHDQTAEVERHIFKENKSTDRQSKLEKSGEEKGTNLRPVELEPEILARSPTSNEQSALRSRLASEFQFPKTKRKRGERKASFGGWSRRQSGQPDSQ